jgi:hypothetical protein
MIDEMSRVWFCVRVCRWSILYELPITNTTTTTTTITIMAFILLLYTVLYHDTLVNDAVLLLLLLYLNVPEAPHVYHICLPTPMILC